MYRDVLRSTPSRYVIAEGLLRRQEKARRELGVPTDNANRDETKKYGIFRISIVHLKLGGLNRGADPWLPRPLRPPPAARPRLDLARKNHRAEHK